MIRFRPMYVDVSVVVSAAPVRRTKARAKASVASSEIRTTKGVSFRGFVTSFLRTPEKSSTLPWDSPVSMAPPYAVHGLEATPGSPGNRLAVAVEPAGRVLREHHAEDDGSSADRHAPGRAAASHVGADPPGAYGIDSDASRRKFPGQEPSEGIEGNLRYRIGGRPARALGLSRFKGRKVRGHEGVERGPSERRIRELRAEIPTKSGQLAEPARHHDDAAAVRDEGKEGVGHVSRSEVIRLDRANRGASIGSPGTDPRIVYEEVEAGNESWEVLRNGGDARAIRDVQLMIQHIAAIGIQSSNRRGSLFLVAAREDHTETPGAELGGRFEPQAAICPGDERGWAIRLGPHDFGNKRCDALEVAPPHGGRLVVAVRSPNRRRGPTGRDEPSNDRLETIKDLAWRHRRGGADSVSRRGRGRWRR